MIKDPFEASPWGGLYGVFDGCVCVCTFSDLRSLPFESRGLLSPPLRELVLDHIAVEARDLRGKSCAYKSPPLSSTRWADTPKGLCHSAFPLGVALGGMDRCLE